MTVQITKRSQRGVTLLELLIAVTLMSLLSTGILYAMRVGLMALEKTNNRFIANRRVIGVERALQQQLAGLIPVGAPCLGPSGAPGGQTRFFQGQPQAMRFLTNYSLNEASRGYPRIVEYSVIPGEDNLGVRLIVNETVYTGPMSLMGQCLGITTDPVRGFPQAIFRPIQPRPDSFVLADKLASVRFVFLEKMPPPVLQQWMPSWSAPAWPLAIRMELIPLDANPGNLDVATTTIPIRVTADPFKKYAD
jgi:prepilin-type N-terminal cleavage/methylation domain-containing protein